MLKDFDQANIFFSIISSKTDVNLSLAKNLSKLNSSTLNQGRPKIRRSKSRSLRLYTLKIARMS